MNKKISQLLIRKISQGIPWRSSGLGQCTFAVAGMVQSLVGELSFHKTWCGKKESSLLVVVVFYVLLTVTDDDILIISCGGDIDYFAHTSFHLFLLFFFLHKKIR